MIVKKKQLLTATLVLALGAAVFVNWYFTKPHPSVTAADSSVQATQAAENLGDAMYVASDASGREDPFAEARLKREKAHSAAAETLQQVIEDPAATQAAVSQASAELTELTERMTLEADVETLVQAKTGMENLVILSRDSAQILLSAPPKESAVMLQITEIAARKASLEPAQITIIEAKTAEAD